MQVEHEKARLHPALHGLVAGLQGYRIDDAPPGVHIGMPSRNVTVIIALDQPIVVHWASHARAAGDADLVVTQDRVASGLHAGPAWIHHDGYQYGLQLDLTPAGARLILGLPAAQICGASVDLDELTGPSARRLAERCAQRGTWAARFVLVQRWLLDRADRNARGGVVAAELDWAWRRLSARDGARSVADLAREVGWSTRHLGVRFGAEYGLSPKLAARVMRFERSHRAMKRHLAAGDDLQLAAVAAECGYADQSHLNRDWLQFAGTSPTRWLREDQIVFVQDPLPART